MGSAAGCCLSQETDETSSIVAYSKLGQMDFLKEVENTSNIRVVSRGVNSSPYETVRYCDQMRTLYGNPHNIVRIYRRPCGTKIVYKRLTIPEEFISELNCHLDHRLKQVMITPSYVAKHIDHMGDFSCGVFIYPYQPMGDTFRLLKATYLHPESVIAALFIQLLHLVDKLHDAGYAHGDIRLENIVVNAEGKLRLIDGGMSQKLTTEHGIPVTVPRISMANGCAPETLREQLCQATDIWCIGSWFFAALTWKEFSRNDRRRVLKYSHDPADYWTTPDPFNGDNDFISPDTLTFIDEITNMSSAKRPTTKKLLGHSWVKTQKRKKIETSIEGDALLFTDPKGIEYRIRKQK